MKESKTFQRVNYIFYINKGSYSYLRTSPSSNQVRGALYSFSSSVCLYSCDFTASVFSLHFHQHHFRATVFSEQAPKALHDTCSAQQTGGSRQWTTWNILQIKSQIFPLTVGGEQIKTERRWIESLHSSGGQRKSLQMNDTVAQCGNKQLIANKFNSERWYVSIVFKVCFWCPKVAKRCLCCKLRPLKYLTNF